MKIVLLVFVFIGFLFASVDINNANQKDFTTLKGVGSKKAEQIVVFRKTNGCFKSINELAKVKGIGKKTVEKNKGNLTLGKCPN
ncbi:ComEA family DNA-binding protein [Sulfurospirillum arcachonense]|uniref:ComEA family DNA-binding protein n=1 Tax=Sulfurospirillum arcachonense TaxID=57666 RepID=UPI00046A11E8|nr:helix-hairpin-helix domain-containing protein [Sulfurospirillum arcachonense]